MKASRIFNLLMALFLIAAGFSSAQPAAAQESARPIAEILANANYVPGEVIVTFAPGASASKYKAQAAALAGEVSAQVASVNGDLALLSFAEDADVPGLVAMLSGKAGVLHASPNYIGSIPEAGMYSSNKTANRSKTASASEEKARFAGMRSVRKTKSVPTYPTEWVDADTDGWDLVHADVIWANTVVSPQVCVLDTGADNLHPDLKGKVLAGKDFVNTDNLANDDNGHGTHVAGIIVANNLNKYGIMGVSNGTVLPVKALNWEGYGNEYDLIEGIRYCANQSAVKVINMSVGGYYPSDALYSALKYAIVTKGKFVVAAAGNESTSDFESAYAYPGAWGSPKVCPDGSYDATEACGGAPNDIDHGMVAVAAGYSTKDPYVPSKDADNSNYYWVDMDNSGATDNNLEEFYYQTCLADFSNYGNWVEMVAPGEDIYSTLPVSGWYTDKGSNPFYEDTSPLPGYGWSSGTSMAAPQVAGVVARMLSVYKTTTNVSVPSTQDRLLDGSEELIDFLAVDTGVTALDAPLGYTATSYDGELPYCIPTALGNYTAKEDMAAAKYANVAKAMNRVSAEVFVRDGTNGFPLSGATVSAYQGTALKDKAIVGKFNSETIDYETSVVRLINLPADTNLLIKVAKPGYAVNAHIATVNIPNWQYNYTDEYLTVTIPPSAGRVSLVADWDYGDWYGNLDLDLYTYIDSLTANPYSYAVGNSLGESLFYNSGVIKGSLNPNTTGDGTLNGEYLRTAWFGDFKDTYLGMLTGNEVVSMATNPTLTSNPYWNSTSSSQFYSFYLTDYGAGGDDMSTYTGPVVARLWRGGIPVAAKIDPENDSTYVLEAAATAPYAYSLFEGWTTTCDADGVDNLVGSNADNADNEWLKIGRMVGKDLFVDDDCVIGDPEGDTTSDGNVGGGLPYSVDKSPRNKLK